VIAMLSMISLCVIAALVPQTRQFECSSFKLIFVFIINEVCMRFAVADYERQGSNHDFAKGGGA